jgi:hypothetical protein
MENLRRDEHDSSSTACKEGTLARTATLHNRQSCEEVVARGRLLDLLRDARSHRTILISGPPERLT